MKKMFTIVACCLLSAAAFASAHVPGKPAPASRELSSSIAVAASVKAPHEAVLICHKGREITVDANAVPAHLAHGDRVGSCSGTPGRAATK